MSAVYMRHRTAFQRVKTLAATIFQCAEEEEEQITSGKATVSSALSKGVEAIEVLDNELVGLLAFELQDGSVASMRGDERFAQKLATCLAALERGVHRVADKARRVLAADVPARLMALVYDTMRKQHITDKATTAVVPAAAAALALR